MTTGNEQLLLEREGEVERLRATLAGARAGRGRAVLVEGPAGIGKTRLLEEAHETASEAGLPVLVATGSRLEADFAFGVARQLFEPVLTAADPAERERLFAAAPRVARLFPRFAPSPDSAGDADIASGVAQDYPMLQGLYSLVAELAEKGGAIVVDDLQWADEPSQRFLYFLAHRLQSVPIALFLAARPRAEWAVPDLHDRLSEEASIERLRPRPLSGDAAGVLVGATLEQAVDRAFAGACREATGGNPFYLHQLARELAVSGIEPVEARARELERLAPEAVERSVSARLADLPAAATAVARAAAVLGQESSLELVAGLSRTAPEAASQAADALRAAGILDPRARLAFAHSILRAAVYERMPAGERAALHARAAALLLARGAAPEAVAAQLLLAEPGACELAAQTLRLAAHEALHRGAPDAAARYLSRAIEEEQERGDRARTLLELGTAEALHRAPEAAGHLSESIAAAEDPDDRLLAALALWSTYSFDGRVEEGLDVLRSALEAAGGARPDAVLRLELELARGARSCRPTAAEGRRRIAALRAHLTGSESPLERLALGLVAYDALLANRPVGEVVELIERALPLEDGVLERTESQLLHPPIYTLIYCDRLEQARGLLGELGAEARARGSAIGVAVGSVWRSLAHLRQGMLREAEVDGLGALQSSVEHGWRFGEIAANVFLADIAIERGDLDAAARLHGRIAGTAGARLDVKGWSDHVRHGRARLSLARGDAGRALEELLSVGRLHDQWQARCPSELPWRSDAALAAAATGDARSARRLASEEVELAREFGAARALGIALRAEGLVTGGAAGTALLEEAVSVLERSPARLEHARALTDLGALLRGRGRLKLARDPLRQGLDLALRCGADALVERARSELVASGARPRRFAVVGVAALTASELRVARMAADGASNADIAGTLFVTRKTVEAHLTSSYQKLGIGSRAGLAGALDGEEEPAAVADADETAA